MAWHNHVCCAVRTYSSFCVYEPRRIHCKTCMQGHGIPVICFCGLVYSLVCAAVSLFPAAHR